ncbi:MAG TPA: hypothetical protein VMU38_03900 [Candidatus Binatia bacterium]|nr:hypothetical protein [Candidatus Binatia bacterium]
MNALLPFALQMLERHAEFYPYGGALGQGGEFVPVSADEPGDHQLSEDLIASVKRALAAGARIHNYKAVGVVYDAKTALPATGEQSDAIVALLEHQNGYSIDVFFPYVLEGQSVVLGPPLARQGTLAIFEMP